MTLARRWKGERPFQETWFVEALFSADRGLWVRYVLDAGRGEAQVWALVVARDGVVARHLEVFPLEAVRGAVFHSDRGSLARDRSTGRVGPIRWDLELDDLGVRHRHQPPPLDRIGKRYVPAILDLRVRGTLCFGGERWEVSRGMGVVGHHWGRRSRIREWAWAHCNAFERDGIVFEGLSARVGPLRATSLVLHVDGHTYGFSRLRDVLRTWSHTGTDRWAFEARRGSAVLAGELRLDPTTAATVRYDRADAPPFFCTNTRFGTVHVVFRDPDRGIDLDLRSREAAFELVGPTPRGAVCLP